MTDFNFMSFPTKEARKQRWIIYAICIASIALLTYATAFMDRLTEKNRFDALQKQALFITKAKAHKVTLVTQEKNTRPPSRTIFLTHLAEKIPDTIALTQIMLKANTARLRGSSKSIEDIFNFIQAIAGSHNKHYQISITKNHCFKATIALKNSAKASHIATLRRLLLEEIHNQHILLLRFFVSKSNQALLSFLATFAESLHFLSLFSKCQSITLSNTQQESLIKVDLACRIK